MKNAHVSKRLRMELSIIAGLLFWAVAIIVTAMVMHEDTMVFWIPAEGVCAAIAAAGINDAIKKGGEA